MPRALPDGAGILILDDYPEHLLNGLQELVEHGVVPPLRPCLCLVTKESSATAVSKRLRDLLTGYPQYPASVGKAARAAIRRADIIELRVPSMSGGPFDDAVRTLRDFVNDRGCVVAMVDLLLDAHRALFGGGKLISAAAPHTCLQGVVYWSGKVEQVAMTDMLGEDRDPPWLRRLAVAPGWVAGKLDEDSDTVTEFRSRKGEPDYHRRDVVRAVLHVVRSAERQARALVKGFSHNERVRARYLFSGHAESDRFSHYMEGYILTKQEADACLRDGKGNRGRTKRERRFVEAWSRAALQDIRPGEPLSKLATLMSLGLTENQYPGLFEVRDCCRYYTEGSWRGATAKCEPTLTDDQLFAGVMQHFNALFSPPTVQEVIDLLADQAHMCRPRYGISLSAEAVDMDLAKFGQRRLAVGTLSEVHDIIGNLLLNACKYRALDTGIQLQCRVMGLASCGGGRERQTLVVSVFNQYQALEGQEAERRNTARDGGSTHSCRIVSAVNAWAEVTGDRWGYLVKLPSGVAPPADKQRQRRDAEPAECRQWLEGVAPCPPEPGNWVGGHVMLPLSR